MPSVPNILNTRPDLLLDFLNSGLLHPDLISWRGSPATVFTSAGKLITVPGGTPRLQYDPATGFCEGLISEPQRTNELKESKVFGRGSHWYVGANSQIANGVPGPDGVPFGVLTNGPGGNAFVSTNYVMAPGETKTMSVYWRGNTKPAQGSLILMDSVGPNNAATRSELAFNDPSVIADGRLRRYSLTAQNQGSVAGSLSVYIGVDTGVAALEFWAPQLEVGTAPTSYISTDDVPAMRQSERVFMVGESVRSAFYRPEWTFVLSAKKSKQQAQQWPYYMAAHTGESGDSTNSVYVVDQGPGAISVGGPAGELTYSVPEDEFKVAVNYRQGGLYMSVNGSWPLVVGSAMPPSLTQLTFGGGSGQNAERAVQRLAAYPTSCTLEELQKLSTP